MAPTTIYCQRWAARPKELLSCLSALAILSRRYPGLTSGAKVCRPLRLRSGQALRGWNGVPLGLVPRKFSSHGRLGRLFILVVLVATTVEVPTLSHTTRKDGAASTVVTTRKIEKVGQPESFTLGGFTQLQLAS